VLKKFTASLETGSKFIHEAFASMHDEKEQLQLELCALVANSVLNCQLIDKAMLANFKGLSQDCPR
jgi:hypothetical protein